MESSGKTPEGFAAWLRAEELSPAAAEKSRENNTKSKEEALKACGWGLLLSVDCEDIMRCLAVSAKS